MKGLWTQMQKNSWKSRIGVAFIPRFSIGYDNGDVKIFDLWVPQVSGVYSFEKHARVERST